MQYQGGQPFGSVNGVNTTGRQPFAKYPDADGRLVQTWSNTPVQLLAQDQLAETTKKLAEQEPYVQLMRALIRP